MNDTNSTIVAAGPTAAEQAAVFQLQRRLPEDASLEMPHAPRFFLEAEAPSVDINWRSVHEPVIDAVHELLCV